VCVCMQTGVSVACCGGIEKDNLVLEGDLGLGDGLVQEGWVVLACVSLALVVLEGHLLPIHVCLVHLNNATVTKEEMPQTKRERTSMLAMRWCEMNS
jgi:hypothetical protein